MRRESSGHDGLQAGIVRIGEFGNAYEAVTTTTSEQPDNRSPIARHLSPHQHEESGIMVESSTSRARAEPSTSNHSHRNTSAALTRGTAAETRPASSCPSASTRSMPKAHSLGNAASVSAHLINASRPWRHSTGQHGSAEPATSAQRIRRSGGHPDEVQRPCALSIIDPKVQLHGLPSSKPAWEFRCDAFRPWNLWHSSAGRRSE